MIAIIADPDIGGTFLTWSIYYLTGKLDYFSVKNNSQITLPDNPLTSKNAHGFSANQLTRSKNLDHYLSALSNKDQDECIYMHQFRTNTKETVEKLCSSASRTIVLSISSDHIFYNCKYQKRSDFTLAWTSDADLTDPDDIYNDFIAYFFKESKQRWDSEGLKDIWDTREFIALSIDPYNHDSILNYVDDKNAYYLNALDLWTNFTQTIRSLFDYLHIKIDESRYQQWEIVYAQWKKVHTNRLNFCQKFNTIIDNILRGTNFDLVSFDLDICQEAAIQHVLIYQHHLNLKTWLLTKFNNTKQLHDLLEPNRHDLSKNLTKRLTA